MVQGKAAKGLAWNQLDQTTKWEAASWPRSSCAGKSLAKSFQTKLIISFQYCLQIEAKKLSRKNANTNVKINNLRLLYPYKRQKVFSKPYPKV